VAADDLPEVHLGHRPVRLHAEEPRWTHLRDQGVSLGLALLRRRSVGIDQAESVSRNPGRIHILRIRAPFQDEPEQCPQRLLAQLQRPERLPTSGDTASALTGQAGCNLRSTDSASSRPASIGRLRSTSTTLPDA